MPRYHFSDDEPYVVVERHESAGIAPFLVGVAVGAGVALLFAPRSGAATRRDIARRANRVKEAAEQAANDVTESVVNTYEDAKRRVEEQIDSARQAVDLKRRQVNRAFDAGRSAARQAREELEQRIAETKVAYNSTGPTSPTSAPSSTPASQPATTVDFVIEEIDEV
jgi:gas vesicle protein